MCVLLPCRCFACYGNVPTCPTWTSHTLACLTLHSEGKSCVYSIASLSVHLLSCTHLYSIIYSKSAKNSGEDGHVCELCTLYCSVQQGSIRMAGGGGCVTHMEPGGILLGALLSREVFLASLINSVCVCFDQCCQYPNVRVL